MKITREDYQYLKQRIEPLKAQFPVALLAFKNNPRIKDANKALRWEALRASGLIPWVCTNLYGYMNDDHIDTALRSIMAELTLPATINQ